MAACGEVAFAEEYNSVSVPYLLPDANHPINLSTTDPLCFGSWHAKGANLALADGSCVFLNNAISGQLYEALGTPSGGETIDLDTQ